MSEGELNRERRIALFQREEIRRMIHHDDCWFVTSDVIAALTRLKEPPEPSPGLSAAMPWVLTGQRPRPEGAREALGKSNRIGLNLRQSPNGQFSRPFRVERSFAFQSQGIALARSALGYIPMAFQAIPLSQLHTAC